MLLPLLLNNLLEDVSIDGLLADDVESASELTTPSVGQEQVLLADDVQSVSEVSVPGIGGIAAVPSGGWIVRDVFDTFADRKRRKLAALRERLEEVEEIAGIDGEIAVLLHQNDEKQLIESSLKELENLVKSNISRTQIEQQFNTRVAKAFTRASVQGNFSALQAFEREMERVREEEAFFLIAAVMILQ